MRVVERRTEGGGSGEKILMSLNNSPVFSERRFNLLQSKKRKTVPVIVLQTVVVPCTVVPCTVVPLSHVDLLTPLSLSSSRPCQKNSCCS